MGCALHFNGGPTLCSDGLEMGEAVQRIVKRMNAAILRGYRVGYNMFFREIVSLGRGNTSVFVCGGEATARGFEADENQVESGEAVKQVRMPFVSMFTLTVFTAHGPCSMKSLVRTTANASARRPSTH